jgi:hypothetical protein
MSPPTGIVCDQARALIGVLNLLLSIPGIDDDTERRAQWLKLRLQELVPNEAQRLPDFTDARIAWLLAGGALRAA